MTRWSLLALLLACEAPTRIAAPAPAPVIVQEVPAPAPAPVIVQETPETTPWRGGVPADPAGIRAWLQAFAYRGWAPQTEVRATGEHGGERLYFNAALVASVEAGAQEHPIGSAAVRELYDGDLRTLKGFALMHKTGPSGPVGEGWYWYEIFGTTQDAEPTVAEVGARGCVGCHSHAVDFVHSPDTPREDPQPLL